MPRTKRPSGDPSSAARPSRRAVLKTAGGLAGGAAAGQLAAAAADPRPAAFAELAHGLTETHAVAPGHTVQVLLRWGDPLTADAPAWSPAAQSAAAQSRQFGTDNDFTAFMPLPYGSQSSDRGLLCVNHETCRAYLMFAGIARLMDDALTKDMIDVEMAGHGHSVVEIALKDGLWAPVPGSAYNRRITALATPMDLSGPAAGTARMRTKDDPAGQTVIGTFANCAGGVTPWGTVVTAEENFDNYFSGDPSRTPEAENHGAMGIGTELLYAWGRFHDRFHVEKEPNEPNRFGWMVELDPYDPARRPAKRTALGRFKHEGGGFAVNRDGRIACYMGDDEVFQYIYKFVSARPYDPADRGANWGLLDDGTLYAARFEDDGRLAWLPLVWGQGPLTPANGFGSQADVMIDARKAAALLGATAMDRPEDIEVSPANGSVFVALTKNALRRPDQTDAANPRARNRHGHILELIPPAGGNAADHAAEAFQWRPFLLAGDPRDPESGAVYNASVTAAGALSCPDNLVFDPSGRLWITTDGAPDFGFADGLWVSDTTGPDRALTRHFFRCPRGAEATGPAFTPDGSTLFLAVQHPGDGSTLAAPNTRWPDFDAALPPRSSVVAIRRADGDRIV